MGALTSSIGTWMQKVAQAWLIVTMTGSSSAFYLGLDSFAGEAPILLFTIIGGVVADRRDRRHMMLMSQYVQMAVAFTLAVLVVTNVVQVWMVISLSVVAGIAQAFGGPAYQSLIPTLVGKEHLPNAIALNSIQFNLARVIGPILAGVALAQFGMVGCFGLNGVSFLFVIAAIFALRDVHIPPIATESMIDQMRGGLRYVKNSRNLIAVMIAGIHRRVSRPAAADLPAGDHQGRVSPGRRLLLEADDVFGRRRGHRRADRGVTSARTATSDGCCSSSSDCSARRWRGSRCRGSR